MQPTASASRQKWPVSTRRRMPLSARAVSDIVLGPARTGLLTVVAALVLGIAVAMFMQREQAALQVGQTHLVPSQMVAAQPSVN